MKITVTAMLHPERLLNIPGHEDIANKCRMERSSPFIRAWQPCSGINNFIPYAGNGRFCSIWLFSDDGVNACGLRCNGFGCNSVKVLC